MSTVDDDATPDRFDIDDDGFGGYVEVDPAETLEWDGTDLAAVTWHLPLYRAEALKAALEVLDQVVDAMGGATERGPGHWTAEADAIGKALDRLVEQGRAWWHTDRWDQSRTITDGPPRACRVCGCTDDRACVDAATGPCHWVAADLCSACAP